MSKMVILTIKGLFSEPTEIQGVSPDVVFGTPIGAVLKINIKEEALQGHPVSEIIMNGTHFFPVIEQLNMEDLR